jgi:hypothetical protein
MELGAWRDRALTDPRVPGQRTGHRGRFGMYLPPLLEHLGHIELEHNPRNNRARAL